MARGRKAKPSITKKVEGNPGRRRLNKREPKLDASIPQPPEWLRPEARAEWVRIVPALHQAGLIRLVDGGKLAAYCTALGDLQRAESVLAKEGEVVPTGQGGIKPHPFVAIKNAAMASLRGLGSDFGLDAASRSRIEIPEEDDDDFDSFAETKTR